MKKALYTVAVFAKINTLRFFRDRLALFFTVAFPLILLTVFGGLLRSDDGVSFKVALINQSETAFSRQYVTQARASDILKIDMSVGSFDQAKERMKQSQLDAIIVLPSHFGEVKPDESTPSGEAIVYYSENATQAGVALTSILERQFKAINAQFVDANEPFTVRAESTRQAGLSQFDYAFAGIIGFAIIGLGIFGPTSVFPELKKQGVLRRFHTTPLKVWQYFLSSVVAQGIIGLITLSAIFIVALLVFDLQMRGNYLELAVFLLLSILTIYGIGLSIGGWAKNERQAAPLANLAVLPLLFLSGTFFPRFMMPEWLQGVTAYLPLTPVIDGLRLIVAEGQHLVQLGPQLAVLAIWLLVIYAVAFKVFRWE